MNNEKRPTKREIEKSINSIITIDLPDGELYDIVNEVDEHCENSYKEGVRDGIDEGYEDGKRDAFDDVNVVEKFCTEYVVEKFADCHTLADFQREYMEIETRSFNFM